MLRWAEKDGSSLWTNPCNFQVRPSIWVPTWVPCGSTRLAPLNVANMPRHGNLWRHPLTNLNLWIWQRWFQVFPTICVCDWSVLPKSQQIALYHCSYPGAQPLERHEATTVTPDLGTPATSREPWWGLQPAHRPLVPVSLVQLGSVVQTPGATRTYGWSGWTPLSDSGRSSVILNRGKLSTVVTPSSSAAAVPQNMHVKITNPRKIFAGRLQI